MANDVNDTIEQLTALPIEDRLKIVEAVWDSIGEDGSRIPLTEAQRAELERRVAAHDAAPSDALTWSQVLDRVRNQL